MRPVGWAWFAGTCIVWAGLGWRILAFPAGENHAGLSPYLAAPAFVLLAGLGLVRWRREREARFWFAFGILSLLLLWLIDQQNVLVSYERWLSRGMPARPF